MKPLSVETIRQAARGTFVSGRRDAEASGISTDSRTVKHGELFVALSGDNFDGHDYVQAALERGAVGAVCSKDVALANGASHKVIIRVGDTLGALADIARAYRRMLSATVVGITGSNGKTTTKEMTRYLLEERMSVAASKASFNNFIGVPLTLFTADAATKVVILEMGTNHPGEIAHLASIAAPDIGVITNVGRTHLEGLKSIDGVAAAKAELLHGIEPGGAAILNADDASFAKLRKAAASKVFTFGMKKPADVFAAKAERSGDGFDFLVNGSARARLNVPGIHNVYNALAAISVCRRLGLELAYLAERLAGFRLPPMRLEELSLRGALVINDAYNANPESMARAVEEFAARGAARKFFIFGDMRELGGESAALHCELGAQAARANFDFYWAVGLETRHALEAAESAGVPAGRMRHFATVEELGRELKSSLAEGDAALLKGSRAMGLEKIIEMLK